LSFEANRGQTDAAVQFLARGPDYNLFLTRSEAVLVLDKADARPAPAAGDTAGGTTAVVRMQVVGADPAARVSGLGELPGKSNYFIGNDPSGWVTGVPHYGRVAYQGVYPGVDLVYYGTGRRQVEFDFVVAPGADPGAIRLDFQGTDTLRLNAQGDLILPAVGGDLVQHAPALYQEAHGVRHDVAGRYVLRGPHEVGLAVGAHDANQPLVIDPVLSYSTYLGGNGDDEGRGIAVDRDGNAYVTGVTASLNFPTLTPFRGYGGGPTDAFVTKFNANGTLGYSTYLGGSAGEDIFDGDGAIAVDPFGNACVTGSTSSADFPTRNAAQPTKPGIVSAFVTKLNSAGNGLIYSTYLGGSWEDRGQGIAVDSTGGAYVTGMTRSSDFPTTNATQTATGGGYSDAFVARFTPDGGGRIYSSYVGGNEGENQFWRGAIAVDASGNNIYVTGCTSSTNFPLANAWQGMRRGIFDAFVTKLTHTGSTYSYVYSTYFGGGGNEAGRGIAADASGNAYVTGFTTSADFPTTPGAFQTTFGGTGAFPTEAFVAEFNAAGALVYSTYLGGIGPDSGNAIAVGPFGQVYVAGETGSPNFPTRNPVQPSIGGGLDGFVAKLDLSRPGPAALLSSTYLGGSNEDRAEGIAVDSSGCAYVTGVTNSSNFPIQNAFQPAFGGGTCAGAPCGDAFATKIAFWYAPAVNYSAGTQPISVAMGDFNGDGFQDLAVPNFNMGLPGATVGVLLNNGDGTFSSAVNYPVDNGPQSVAVGDFDGDGIPDLVTANYSGTVSVLLGNGDGTFRPAVNYGDGTFQAALPFRVAGFGNPPVSVAVGDVNGDGYPDVAATDLNSSTGNVSVLRNLPADWS
jgi:hypothetical protein